jgi:hypothetical protein
MVSIIVPGGKPGGSGAPGTPPSARRVVTA